MRALRWLLLLALLSLHAQPARASPVYPHPLSEVMQQARWVMEATLLATEIEPMENGARVHYLVEPGEVLLGEGTVDHMLFILPTTLRTHRDGTAMRVSPYTTGNGKEAALEVGKRYLFIGSIEPANVRPHPLLRVEPLANKARVVALLPAAP